MNTNTDSNTASLVMTNEDGSPYEANTATPKGEATPLQLSPLHRHMLLKALTGQRQSMLPNEVRRRKNEKVRRRAKNRVARESRRRNRR
jgi:hypothetical protein